MILRVPVRYQKFSKELLSRALLVLICVGVGGAFLAVSYKPLVLTIRENMILRVYVNPTYPLYALNSYFKQSVKSAGQKIQAIGEQPTRSAASKVLQKRSVVVFVLGETARRVNFSLNSGASYVLAHLP